MSLPEQLPHLIVANQTVNPAFNDWLRELVKTVGPIELWTGNAQTIGENISVRKATAYDRSSHGARLQTWLRFTVSVVWHLLRNRNRAPLLAVTNPPFLPLVAALSRRLQKRRFALLEWDIYPQILRTSNLVSERHPLYKAWYRWHAQVLREADVVVTISECMANVLKEMAGDPQLPILVIPNWIDTDWIKPYPRAQNPFAREHGLEDKVVVLYSGNFGATHAIETILMVAEQLRNADNLRFVLIGDGAKQSLIEQAIRSGRTPNIKLLPRQPAALLPHTLTSADIGIVTLGRGYETLSMPSKTYALLAAGNAILGVSHPPNDLAATINRYGCGANFRPDDPTSIAKWIEETAADCNFLKALKEAARTAAVNYFSADKVPVQLTKVLQEHLLS